MQYSTFKTPTIILPSGKKQYFSQNARDHKTPTIVMFIKVYSSIL